MFYMISDCVKYISQATNFIKCEYNYTRIFFKFFKSCQQFDKGFENVRLTAKNINNR